MSWLRQELAKIRGKLRQGIRRDLKFGFKKLFHTVFFFFFDFLVKAPTTCHVPGKLTFFSSSETCHVFEGNWLFSQVLEPATFQETWGLKKNIFLKPAMFWGTFTFLLDFHNLPRFWVLLIFSLYISKTFHVPRDLYFFYTIPHNLPRF